MSVPAGAQVSASTTGPTGYLCSAIDADPALRSSALSGRASLGCLWCPGCHL